MGTRRISLVLLFVLGTVLGATDLAGGLTPSTAKAKPPDGYHMVTVKKAGMTMAVPESWFAVDLTRRPIDAFMRQLKKSDPKGAAMVAARRDFLATNGLFAAYDPDAKPSSAFVTVAATTTGAPLIPTGHPDVVQAAYAQNLGINDSQVADGSLAGAPAAVITSTTHVPVGKGRTTTLHNSGYVVATKDGALQVDFAGPKDASRDKTVQTMIASVRLDEVTVPTHATFSGAVNGSEVRGSGSGTPFGDTNITTTIQPFGQPPSCGPGPAAPAQGFIYTQTANSGIMNQTFSGTVCQSGSHISGNLILFEFDFSGTYSITGGNDCFTNATGSGTLTAHSSANGPNTASLDSTSTGTVTLKNRPNCPYFPG